MNSKVALLILILALAIFLRVWGIESGLPYFFVNDERAQVYGALKMAELKTLIPALHPEEFKILYYMPLMSYIYLFFLAPFILISYLTGSFANFTELGNYFILNPAPLWLIARLINALIGAATVYLMYLIGKKMFNHWVGLIAASFLALNFLHIQLSHFTRPWSSNLFFFCLILLLSFHIYKNPQKKYYLWLGIIAGLGFGISYVILITLVIPLLVHFLSDKFSFQEKIKDKNLWQALMVFSLITSVFILLYPQEILRFITGGSGSGVSFTKSKDIAGYLSSLVYYFKVILFYDPIILIFSIAGVISLWFWSKRVFFIFWAWPLFYISVWYLIFHHEPRYALPLVPWVVVLASYTLYRLIIKFPIFVRVMILLLVFSYPLAVAWQYGNLLTQEDTRILAKEWVEGNIPAGSKIISNWARINPTPTKESILLQGEMDDGSLRVADRVLLGTDDEHYPRPAYDILRLAYVKKEKLSIGEGFQYFLVAFWDENNLSPEEKSIIKNAQLIQEFKPGGADKAEDVNAGGFFRPASHIFSLERLGPIIRIYKL